MADTCGHWAGDRHCGATPTRAYDAGPRCAAHTPAAVAGLPEPGADRYCPPAICWCGTCPHAARPVLPTPDTAGWAAIDARAIASGKRRSTPEAYAAARDTVTAQKTRDRQLRTTRH